MYESQKGQLDQQVFNMDQSHYALQSMRDNQVLFFFPLFSGFISGYRCCNDGRPQGYEARVQEDGHWQDRGSSGSNGRHAGYEQRDTGGDEPPVRHPRCESLFGLEWIAKEQICLLLIIAWQSTETTDNNHVFRSTKPTLRQSWPLLGMNWNWETRTLRTWTRLSVPPEFLQASHRATELPTDWKWTSSVFPRSLPLLVTSHTRQMSCKCFYPSERLSRWYGRSSNLAFIVTDE